MRAVEEQLRQDGAKAGLATVRPVAAMVADVLAPRCAGSCLEGVRTYPCVSRCSMESCRMVELKRTTARCSNEKSEPARLPFPVAFGSEFLCA